MTGQAYDEHVLGAIPPSMLTDPYRGELGPETPGPVVSSAAHLSPVPGRLDLSDEVVRARSSVEFLASRFLAVVAENSRLCAEASRLAEALAAVEALCARAERSAEGGVAAPRVLTVMVRECLAAARPGEPTCTTCNDTGQVSLEHQIGAPGSGGEFTCPDCGPTIVEPVGEQEGDQT